MSKTKISPIGTSWNDLEQTLYTPQEIADSKLRVSLIHEIIEAREKSGITQKQLEEMSGVKQPIISRLENGTTDPQLSTLLKILGSLGKTLQIIPLDNSK